MTLARNVPVPDIARPTAVRRRLLAGIVRDIWSSRELLAQFVKRDLRLRYRQAVMGFAWAIFMPILTVGAGLLVRSAVTRTGAAGAVSTVGGMVIKAWAWTFFAGAMNFATTSLLTNINLVTKIYFPREVLPLSSIATQCVDSLVGLALIIVISPWLGFHWSWQVLWVPVLIVLLLAFTTGLAFLFACANLFFRDVKYILQVLLTFGIFFTPVFFEPTTFSAGIARLMMLNPLSANMEGLRLSLTQSGSLLHTLTNAAGTTVWTPWYLAYATAGTLLCLIVGVTTFRRTAAMFAEYS
jgi:ABC-type polysaccharide/polyol phosphate export permease